MISSLLTNELLSNRLLIMWIQKEITIKAKSRGFHLITDEVLAQLPELNKLNIGLMNL